MKGNKKTKHLMVGALPPPIGGTTVLFQQLTQALQDDNEVALSVVSTSVYKNNVFFKIIAALRVSCICLIKMPRYDSVSFHGSISGVMFFSPILFILTRILNKKFIIRTFGGDFDIKYDQMSVFERYLFDKTVLKAELILFETKKSVEKFKKISRSTIDWHANSRPLQDDTLLREKKNNHKMNFVFLGHVNREKGVADLVKAFSILGDDVHLNVYGSLTGDIERESLKTNNITYHGLVNPEDINDILFSMDVLVLPTSYIGEGYPGAILEAYACGLPVISTNWRCIPEIVSNDSGILITPGDIQALVDAVNCFRNDESFYHLASSAAKKKASLFDSQHWEKIYIEQIRE